MNLKRQQQAVGDDLIPDFCRAPALLSLAFIMELVAISLALAANKDPAVLDRFLLLSVYLQWIGFCSAAVLCLARRRLRHAPARVMFPVAWVLLLAVTLIISASGYEILLRIDPTFRAAPEDWTSFVFRHFFIGAVVSLLVLRLFWVQHRWRAQARAESEFRYEALQARIRPHFLFNSLNSIAALAGSRPQDAERLIEDLSELMRAGLDQRSRLAPLADEITLVKAYLRIEQARLGDRLQLGWEIPEDTLSLDVPLLSVQPLVENAIYHGVERCEGPSRVQIAARREGDTLQIEIRNPRPAADATPRAGQRIAVDNIAQRLALIYGDKASLTLGDEGDLFVSCLRVPAMRRSDIPGPGADA